jgi:hypothetical protein
MSRPSPSESATFFKLGTIKIGNNKNKWIITETKSGIKRWSKYEKKSKNNNLIIKNNNIIQFQLNKIKKFNKVGIFESTSNISVGELYMNPASGLSKFKAGKYYVYNIDDNFVLSKIIITKSYIKNAIWKYSKISVPVDSGTFGFWNSAVIKDLSCDKNKKIIRIPRYNQIWNKSNYNRTLFVKIKNLQVKNYEDYEDYKDTIIGVVSPTQSGDGGYNLYIDDQDQVLLLLGGFTYDKIIKKN